jgi:hypothetical protein
MMAQKAEIIVEHFRKHTAPRMGGRAKAMVVTGSREAAVRLYTAIKKYIETNAYAGSEPLVAFSGVLELDGVEVTEARLNGFGGGELPERFGYTAADDKHAGTPKAKQDREYKILVVAEKYQTGFDQPLLTTMYVDKPLKGVAAVQTLSRLNRTHPRKTQGDVFVLDFVNEAADIAEQFKPYFETAATIPTDPNLLYTAQHEVMSYPLLVESEMQAYAEAEDAGVVRRAGPRRGRRTGTRAVPPVLDAAGDCRGVHPRRAGQLHHLPALLRLGQAGGRRSGRAAPQGGQCAGALPRTACGEHRPDRDCDRRALPLARDA